MAAESNTIPVITATAPSDDEEGPGPMHVEDPLEVAAREIEAERKNMDLLCSQVQDVGLDGHVLTEKDELSAYQLIVLTNISIGSDRFTHNGVVVRWICFEATTIEATNTIVTRFIDDPSLKRVIVDCYSKFLKCEPVNDVMQAIRQICNKSALVYSSKLCFSSAVFPPHQERFWEKYSAFNVFVRNINIAMKMSPLSNHKGTLKKVKHLTKLATRGDCWQEKQNNTGLGSTLSSIGVQGQKTWFGDHLCKGMFREVSTDTSCTVKEDSPAKLQHTPGYKSPEMVTFLKQIGTYVEGSMPPTKERWGKKNKFNQGDYLRPDLSSINRRGSNSSSSSSASSRRSSYVPPRYNKRPAQDINLQQLQRENSDQANMITQLKADRLKEDQERRNREEKHILRLDHLHNELEHMGFDRRSLSSKLLKAEQDYIYMKEERDRLREEISNKKKEDRR